MTEEDIERVRRWLSMPESRIGSGGEWEIADLVEAELASTTPDLGRVVALCALRVLREYDFLYGKFPYRRVKVSRRMCRDVVSIDPEDVGNEQWSYSFWLSQSKDATLNSRVLLDRVVADCLVLPTIENLAAVIGLVLALNNNEGDRND